MRIVFKNDKDVSIWAGDFYRGREVIGSDETSKFVLDCIKRNAESGKQLADALYRNEIGYSKWEIVLENENRILLKCVKRSAYRCCRDITYTLNIVKK